VTSVEVAHYTGGGPDRAYAATERLRKAGLNPEPFLLKKSGQQFYNTSPLDLKNLMVDRNYIGENLRKYIEGFSPAVREIFVSFDFHAQIERLSKAKLLYLIADKFAQIDLHLDVVSNTQMGLVFEELIRKCAELSNESAGEHFTPREVIRLMVNLIFIDDVAALTKPGVLRSIYDPTAGTGGMLSIAGEHLATVNPESSLVMFGQELNTESSAICKANMLIKGQDTANIIFGNSLSNDGLSGKHFDYMISNPPFGVEWKRIEHEIRNEAEQQGFNGRFGPGLPRVSDGSLLFLLHLIFKMKPAVDGGSRFGIVLNGSQLTTGGAGSGESEIRKYVLENDLVEAIIGLPTDMFYNTGISTYIWIVSNRKPNARKGKVQLIDASSFWQNMRKSLGKKRKELGSEHIDEITRLFGNFEEAKREGALISRIFKNEDFGYRTITVERPERDAAGNVVLGTKGKGRGQPIANADLRDTENVPLSEDVVTYFNHEILPHAPDAWIDHDKTKSGYEIPFKIKTSERFIEAERRFGAPAVRLADLAKEINLGRLGDNFVFQINDNSLYMPIIGNSDVLVSLDGLTLKKQNYAQVVINPSHSSAHFVARFFNTDFGKELREQNKSGFVIPKLNKQNIKDLRVFVPNLQTQLKLLKIEARIASENNTILGLQNEIGEFRRELWANPRSAVSVEQRLGVLSKRLSGGLKEHADERLSQWFESLPFPLSSILRAWQATPSQDFKTKNEHLLHFFEATAEFLSVILLSAFSSNEPLFGPHKINLSEAMKKQNLSFQRATFGTWKLVVEYLGKQTRDMLSTNGKKPDVVKNDRALCSEIFSDITLPEAISRKEIAVILSTTNKMRNDWSGHGGVVGQEEARYRNELLLAEVHKLRDALADTWTDIHLIHALHCRPRSGLFDNEIAVLMGSNSEFLKETRSMATWLDVERLYLSKRDSGRSLKILPLIRVGPSPQSTKNACYFFSRLEREGGARFVSYHFTDKPELSEQFIDATDAIKLLTEVQHSPLSHIS
jgi:type I restriction enzyme M protein